MNDRLRCALAETIDDWYQKEIEDLRSVAHELRKEHTLAARKERLKLTADIMAQELESYVDQLRAERGLSVDDT